MSFAELSDAPPPYDTVVFDCDSTLCSMEGIEELAGPEHAEELRRLTNEAMDGDLPLEEVYGRRLALVGPTREQVLGVGALYVERLLPNVALVVRALGECGKRVVIVSGGLHLAVAVLGEALGLSPEDVFAVEAHWDREGRYRGFDENSPLARSGGKPEVVAALGETGGRRMVLVGDGITDLEAAPHVARFVAFGGVERREAVFAKAVVQSTSPDFKDLLPLLLSPAEIETLQPQRTFAPLFER